MFIVAIDPSWTSTGVSVVGYENEELVDSTRCVPTKSTGDSIADRINRGLHIASAVTDEIDAAKRRFSVCVGFLIEGYSHASGHRAHAMGELGWALRTCLWRHATHRFGGLTQCPVMEVAPAALKKYATGKGNASKTQVIGSVVSRWGVTFDTDDQYDAYVLGRIGAAMFLGAEPTNASQREVLAMLRARLTASQS